MINFPILKIFWKKLKIKKINGITLDLGLSSSQIESSYRGFSFNSDGPLDMRMNNQNKITAKTIINEFSERQLSEIFYYYGEEKILERLQKILFWKERKKKLNNTRINKNNQKG